MRGWSDDEDEASDPRPRHAVAAASGSGAGRSMRGRGFLPSSDQEAGEAPDTPALRCALRGDYEKYTIDPEDTWRPQRKPYVELQDGWEFSNAWSLRPEDGPERLPRDPGPLVGVACWRVDHAEAQAFQVAFASSSREARGWLEGRGGRGEEPCVLELRPCCAGRRWDFRFARASALQAAGWRPLPWAEPRRTSFWAATFPAEGGRRYLCAGVGAFPERRFFAARVAAEPQVVGFGARGALAAFHVRDIVVFGRGSLLGSPFAGRDHFVEAPAAGCREALSALEEAGLREAVLGAVPLAPAGDEGADANAGCLLVCRSPGRAAAVAGALGRGARALVSSQWTWPPEDLDDSAAGPEAAKRFADGAAELWRSLRAGTVRELALFGELLARQTRHCEGTRLARGAALRLILGGLSGPASAPQPPRAGA
ncbi:unnamed protein product [Prorocentrum cordatum]|uniref:Uncharacterized protein n=1 Tax=Prorocentrum cordatum TaxID=2364126 RepID=A0ABN9WTR0_9DINO|nr:unnamed protein product [Polarella glacialis]